MIRSLRSAWPALGGALLVSCASGDRGSEPSRGGAAAQSDSAAAGEAGLAQSSTGSPADLEGTSWVLIEFADGDPVPADVEITVAFSDAGISGKAACNRYSGPVQFEDAGPNAITIGNLVSTRMACVPPLLDAERRYLGALQRLQRFDVADDRLRLTYEGDAGGAPTLLYRRGELGAAPAS